MSDQTSSCCAPDGTCSSQKEADIPKPADHFLSKLRVEQREKIASTLESTQDLSAIKDSLSPELPKYFLKKLLSFIETYSVKEVLVKMSEIK